ncbi:MAG: hypothetical protein JO305_03005 [Alphaproteobacteria bacterium]|nr:hypothetical protein [Alphaproteobacteria bacterium]
MPSIVNVVLTGTAVALFWTAIGWPIARRLAPAAVAGAIAPALGWGVFSAAAMPVLLLCGLTRATAVGVCSAALAVSLACTFAGRRPSAAAKPTGVGILGWGFAAAFVLATAPALAILPKHVVDGVILAPTMFDHSKVAMVDDIARLGLPPGNSFFGEGGGPSRLAYYYLWHFDAAVTSLVLGASGWESDAALTWFTSFASLGVMMGLAVWLGGRRAAALWVVAISLSGSLRPALSFLLGEEGLAEWLSPEADLQSWMPQATWVPQHLASATCVLLAVWLICGLTDRSGWLAVPVLGLLVAAGFGSSAWVGGITFAAAAVPIGLVKLILLRPADRRRFLARTALAAALALAFSMPMLREEYAAAAARGIGLPIALRPMAMLGSAVPSGLRPVLSLPAYWLGFLVVEFPAIYLPGVAALTQTLRIRATDPEHRLISTDFALLALVSLMVGWLFVSTIANNDLGWRAVLPGVMVLTVFAGAGFARWFKIRPGIAAAAAVAMLLAGLPDGFAFLRQSVEGKPTASAAAFAAAPALWQAVRRHAAPDERVGNNPLFLSDMVAWPVNISWALLSNRRSCFAGWALAKAYVALPGAEIDRLERLFERVFAGDGSAAEIHDLAARYGCRVIVEVPSDGVWLRDEFALSPDYHLVEEQPGSWRIYRATAGAVSAGGS